MSSVQLQVVPSSTLEGELASVLRVLGFSARQAGALTVRLGWDGRGGATLARAAAGAGYTRERVRQLETRLRSVAAGRAGHLAKPILEAAIATAQALAPETRGQLADQLWTRGLAASPFDAYGLVQAERVFSWEPRLGLEGSLVVRDRAAAVLPHVRQVARAGADDRGAVSLLEVAVAIGLDVPRTRRLLSQLPDLEWLDRKQTWAALAAPSVVRRTESILAKLFALTPRVPFRDVDEGLRRSFRPVALPQPIVVELCRRIGWLEVNEYRRTVVATTCPDPEKVLSRVERELVALFPPGQAFSYAVGVDRGRRHGLNRNTIAGYLLHSPIFCRVDRGRYMLRGGA